jgi:hypothetical protein
VGCSTGPTAPLQLCGSGSTRTLGDRQDLAEVICLRPNIGLHVDSNLATGIGEKLKRIDVPLADGYWRAASVATARPARRQKN